jgi:two-component system sensor histidine kinase MtrB
MLAAGVSAAALAAGSFLLVRSSRLDDSRDRSLDQARANLVLAATILSGSSTAASAKALLTTFQRRAGFETVILAGKQSFPTSFSVGPQQIPSGLGPIVRAGEIGYERTKAIGTHYLVVGGRPFRSQIELYFFFSEQRLFADVRELAITLFGGTGVLVLLAGFAGALLSRRALSPIAQASQAARSLAEGLLATRLPVERQDEFGSWAASFNEMAAALEEKIQALSDAEARERRFTSDVAHELRTPLTALVGEASLLRDQLDSMPAQARRPAELLVQDIARLRRLVDELMEISRIDAGQEQVATEPVALGTLVEALVRARGWEDRVAVNGDAEAFTDRRRLERILGNLIDNALEHGGNDVRVHISGDAETVSIEVSDMGPGIAPEHLPHVFDRFYKADPARSAGGSGLGLAIAAENARLLGGELEAWSEPGSGTRFTLRLGVTRPLRSREATVASVEEDAGREQPKGTP